MGNATVETQGNARKSVSRISTDFQGCDHGNGNGLEKPGKESGNIWKHVGNATMETQGNPRKSISRISTDFQGCDHGNGNGNGLGKLVERKRKHMETRGKCNNGNSGKFEEIDFMIEVCSITQ